MASNNKQARKLQATLEGCNPELRLTRLLTGVKCRATSVAKKNGLGKHNDYATMFIWACVWLHGSK